jgi:hypothetical protein
MTQRKTGDVYYEWAHKDCHPETCSCQENWRIIEYPYTIAWSETEEHAKRLVNVYTKMDWELEGVIDELD